MTKSAEGIVEKATTFTGTVRKIVIIQPKIKSKTFGLTQWEKETPNTEGFM
jgi:hypothetical protein